MGAITARVLHSVPITSNLKDCRGYIEVSKNLVKVRGGQPSAILYFVFFQKKKLLNLRKYLDFNIHSTDLKSLFHVLKEIVKIAKVLEFSKPT
jgi:hypothetical protein